MTKDSKHKFYPRPGFPLHLPNEEPVLGYLKFSAKGTKREVFGMPIPNDLITDDIQEVSDPDSPAPKLAKATKPKASKQSKPLAPKESTKKPKPAPVKPQEKKRNSLQLVDEFVDEGVPENEPRIGDEEADLEPESGKGMQGQQDESGFEHTVLDKERCRQEQGVHVCHTETA
ncbi:hypothetical protein Tco_1249642 [Tanacetum coccineum]